MLRRFAPVLFAILFLLLVSTFVSRPAQAQATGFYLTYSGSGFSGNIFLTATPNGNGTFTVTSAKGLETFTGGTQKITGVIAPTACCGAESRFYIDGTGHYWSYDDLINPTSPTLLDGLLLIFDVDGELQSVDMYYDATGKYGNGVGYQLGFYVGSGGNDLLDPAFTSYAITSLTITRGPSIAAVEFTQAIQQYQTLADLESSLDATGEPPVPIIADKPAVMRVYFTAVTSATDVVLNASGSVSGSKTISLVPKCEPTDQRARNGVCQSADIYFTPPAGTGVLFTAVLTLTDTAGNQLFQIAPLNVKSRTTNTVNLRAVTVCNYWFAPIPPHTTTFPKTCGNAAALFTLTSTLEWLAPAAVHVQYTAHKVQNALQLYRGSGPGSFRIVNWDIAVAGLVNALYTAADQTVDFAANARTTYVGLYNPMFINTDGATLNVYDGWAAGRPSHGAIAPNQGIWIGVDNTLEEVAHEVGHTLNLYHTGIGPVEGGTPPPATMPPGCFGQPAVGPGGTYWPFQDNLIQYTPGVYEYGFNVATQTVIKPTSSVFDLMSYCIPRWISPIQYDRMITTLGGGTVPQPTGGPQVRVAKEAESEANPKASAMPTVVQGPYWQIRGSIDPVNGLTFDPVFTQTLAASPDAGSGTYSIEVLGAAGQVLYTRYFTPLTAEIDNTDGTTSDSNPYFSEWVPVAAGAASFVVLDPTSTTIGNLAITGTAPVVTITSPTAGFVGSGTAQTVSWTIVDPDSTSFLSRVLYSPDGGTTWISLGDTTDTSDTEDFTQLPGSTNALIRIIVSDGVNTGTATSVPFTVPKKMPSSIAITNPPNGFAQASADPVYLSGGAFDADDGFLTGAALSWKSDIQGALGTGSPLSVTLNPGTHKITLTGTDSDGNAISTSITVVIGGGRPSVALTTSTLSANCISATINAATGTQGAALSQVQYSLDGGATYTAIPLNQLPFSFVVPGSGNINLVAVAADVSRQLSAQSTLVALAGACTTGVPSVSGGSSQMAIVGTAFSTPLSALITDNTRNPVPGVAVNFTAPATGASATLSPATATSNSSGIASTTATANSTNGTYNVVAAVTGFSTTANFNLTNTDFNLGLDNSSLTVAHGSSGTATITVTPLSGFNSVVTLACTGLPVGVTCSFNPATLTPSGAAITSTLTITASKDASTTSTAMLWGLPSGGLVAAFCLFVPGMRRRGKYLGVLALLGVIAVFSITTGCSNFKPFTSTVTVTATSGTLQHTGSINLSVK